MTKKDEMYLTATEAIITPELKALATDFLTWYDENDSVEEYIEKVCILIKEDLPDLIAECKKEWEESYYTGRGILALLLFAAAGTL